MQKYRTGIGQDSHKFLLEDNSKPCVIAGHIFDDAQGLNANSDGDVVFHALCNAISSLTGANILAEQAKELFLKEGVTDSSIFLEEAIKTLDRQHVMHIAISLEGIKPKFSDHFDEMRKNIATIFNIEVSQVGLTANSQKDLTSFGRGEGVKCTAIITTFEEEKEI